MALTISGEGSNKGMKQEWQWTGEKDMER